MAITPVKRRFPRATIRQPGTMTVRPSDERLPKRRVQVAISSISCEGLGLSVSEPVHVEQRSPVTLDFHADGHHFEIPGMVAWVKASPSPGSPTDVGVRLQLIAAPQRIRQDYANWIVGLLRKQGL